jgi:LPXTG-motif cell wall-anchored protein
MLKRLARISLLALAGLLLTGAALAQETVTTEIRNGEVVAVYGNHLVVRTAPNEFREFDVPDDVKFDMDGKMLSVHELKKGMKLTAVITTRSQPMPVVAYEKIEGTVMRVMHNKVWLREKDGIKTYTPPADFMINVEGRKVPVTQLQPGMKVSATIVSTGPPEIVSESEMKVYAQEAPKPAPRPAAAPKPAPAPAPRPAQLPSTGSSVPAIGLLALGLLAIGAGLTLIRRLTH